MVEETPYETVFVARQPVFDVKQNVWGYELLYRHAGTAETAVFNEENEATFRVMTSLSLCSAPENHCSRIMITFPEESIMVHAPYALPPGNTVIKVRETSTPEAYFLEALRDLKQNGYLVAVTGYRDRKDRQLLCQVADILCLEMNRDSPELIREIAASSRSYDALLMGTKIENHAACDLARELGCTFFQGFFFKHPVTYQGRKLSSTDAARLKLFRVIEDLEPNFDSVAQAVESDVSISYRLLTLLNSPAFGFNRKIDSIKQAVVLLGWRHLRNWLRMIILTDLPTPNKTRELSFLCAQRAKFLDTLARKAGLDQEADSLFLLGLFSLLHAMLDMPMQEIVAHLPLSDALRDALCGKDNAYSPWLELMDSVEELEWTRLESCITRLGLNQLTVELAYQEAIAWANSFFIHC